MGFKNQGQFIAALHVSQNLGIPFADLKTAMTGIRPITTAPGSTSGAPSATTTSTTSDNQPLLSLGQAIHKLRPSADSDGAATTATRQASSDISVTATASATASTSTTTTTTTTVPKKKSGK